MKSPAICIVLAIVPLNIAHAQAPYANDKVSKPASGMPPFMAAMKRHNMRIRVVKQGTDGKAVPVGPGVTVGLRVFRGGGAPKDYRSKTGADGVALIKGVPSNPMIQRMIRYEAWAEYGGVEYPYQLTGIPGDGATVELKVTTVAVGDLSKVTARHSIELFADEDALVARHIVRLRNEGERTVNLSALPGGGLMIPCPAGAKHPEVHDRNNRLTEVRGTTILYRGALLPYGRAPAVVNFVYTIPYKTETYEWKQALPVQTTSLTVATPQYKQASQRAAVLMKLHIRGGMGQTDFVDQGPNKKWAVLRAVNLRLPSDSPIHFAVSGLPVMSPLSNQLLIAALVLVVVIVLFGYRRREGDTGLRLSLSHLEAERDRLVRILARMRKATDKGKMSATRYEREQEAITARLVSLYRAIDRLRTS